MQGESNRPVRRRSRIQRRCRCSEITSQVTSQVRHVLQHFVKLHCIATPPTATTHLLRHCTTFSTVHLPLRAIHSCALYTDRRTYTQHHRKRKAVAEPAPADAEATATAAGEVAVAATVTVTATAAAGTSATAPAAKARKTSAKAAPVTYPFYSAALRAPKLEGTGGCRILSWNVAGLRALLKKVRRSAERYQWFAICSECGCDV